MNSRESIKEMLKMLQNERTELNRLSGLLDSKNTVCGDLVYCEKAKEKVQEAYRNVSKARIILACEYVKMVDPEFYDELHPEPDLDVYFEDGVGTENIVVYGISHEGKQISITL